MSACLTPGCKYFTSITSYDFKRSATLKVEVNLPGPLHIPQTNNCVDGFKPKADYLTEIENILHKHMEAAVAEIGQFDRYSGGSLAANWPLPSVTLTDAWSVGHEIGRRSVIDPTPTPRGDHD